MAPWVSYIVAATPRTGSSLLCEGLAATGVAGHPAEVFAPDFREIWYRHWSLPRDCNFRDYVRFAIKNGTTPNGVFGLKIQWMHVSVLGRDYGLGENLDPLVLLFPNSRFVNIIRHDKRAQAISWYRAIATNEWYRVKNSSQAAPFKVPEFDRMTVCLLEREIHRQQSAWEGYFASHSITPLVLDYETLAQDYRGQIGRTLTFLGLDPQQAALIPEPRLTVQRDELSLMWHRQLEHLEVIGP